MASEAALNLVIGVTDKASGPLKSIAGGLGTLGKIGAGAVLGGAVAGVGALSAALVTGIDDAREANIIMAQTENVIKSTGGAAGVTAGHIADLSGELSAASGKSLFGDSQIQESANLLLTFTNLKGGVLDAATAMSVDLAQAMGGAPADSAVQLGKALNDPIAGISALSRVGVSFTDQQKAQIKTMQESGDMAGAQGVILAELNKEFGGSAAAAAAADGGMAQFKDRMGELGESVGAKVLPALNSLMGWLNSPEVQAGITAVVDGLVGGVTKISEVIGAVTAAFQEGGLAGVFDLIMPKLVEFGTNILNWIIEQAPIWGAQLLTWGIAFAQWVIDALPGLMEKLGTLLQTLLTWVADNAPTWAAELVKFGLAAVEWITKAMGPLADKLGEFANKMINWVVDQLPGWGAKLAEFGALAIGWVLDALPGLATNLGTFAGKLIGWILQTILDVVPKLAEMGVKFVSWIVTDVLPELPGTLVKIWDALVLFVQTAAKDIVPILTEMATKFLSWVETDVIPFLSEKLDAILTGISTWVTGAATTVSTYLVSVGTAIVDGIKSGISGAWDTFLGWIDDQIAKIPATIRNFLGIHSPSTVMAEIGKQIPAGLQQGIEDGSDDVTGSLASLTDLSAVTPQMVDQMTTALKAVHDQGIGPWAAKVNEGMRIEGQWMMGALAEGISASRDAVDAAAGIAAGINAALATIERNIVITISYVTIGGPPGGKTGPGGKGGGNPPEYVPGPPSFASGIRNFGGGLAYVHQGEVLANLSRGTDVYTRRESQQMLGGKTVNFQPGSIVINNPRNAEDVEIGLRRALAGAGISL